MKGNWCQAVHVEPWGWLTWNQEFRACSSARSGAILIVFPLLRCFCCFHSVRQAVGALASLLVIAFLGTVALLPWPLQKKGSHLLRSRPGRGDAALLRDSRLLPVGFWLKLFSDFQAKCFAHLGHAAAAAFPESRLGRFLPWAAGSEALVTAGPQLRSAAPAPSLLSAHGSGSGFPLQSQRGFGNLPDTQQLPMLAVLKAKHGLHWTWKGFVQKRGGQVEMFQIKLKQPALIFFF